MNSHSGPRHFHFVSTLPCRRKSSENFVFEGILQIVSHTFLGRANERLSAPSSFIYIHFARQRTKERSWGRIHVFSIARQVPFFLYKGLLIKNL